MKRFVLAAFLKALVITVGFDLICVIYGFISNQPYGISFAGGVICFLVLLLNVHGKDERDGFPFDYHIPAVKPGHARTSSVPGMPFL